VAIYDGDVLRVTCKMLDTVSANDQMNVYHLRYNGPTEDDGVIMSAIRGYMNDAYDEFNEYISDDLSYETIEVFNVTQELPVDEQTWPVLSSGASNADPLPLETAPLVRFPTKAHRSQGRKYLPMPTEETCELRGLLVQDAINALVAFATVIISGYPAGNGGLIPGNWSKIYDRFAPWIAAIIEYQNGVQRRRRTGIGT
jgi:hypothetical protein